MTAPAASTAKPKLVIIVGAGASQAIGLPGVDKISEQSLLAMRVNDGHGDLRNILPDAAQQIRTSYPPRAEPLIDTIRKAHGHGNFEHDINLLENLVALSPPGMALHHEQSPVAKLIHQRSMYEALFDDRTLNNMLDGTIQCVIDVLRDAQAAADLANLQAAQAFVQGIAHDFDVALYNLNYDTTLDCSLGGFNDGFVTDPVEQQLERFSAREFFTAGGPRYAHMHGATNFRVSRMTADGASEYSVVKVDPANPPNRPLVSWAESKTQAGDFALIGSIITGLRKPDKTRSEPYGSYSLALDMDLQRCDRVLIIGYGGSDLYLNWQLIRARQFHGASWKVAWITLGPLVPKDMVLMLGAWFAGAKNNDDIAQLFPQMHSVGALQQFGQLYLAGEGWKPGDVGQLQAIKNALS